MSENIQNGENNNDNSSYEKAEESFLMELKSEYDRGQDLRKILDGKASTMITMSSTFITINTAIATFLISQLSPEGIFYIVSLLLLIASITSALVGSWRFLSSYWLKDYTYPIGHQKFVCNNEYAEDRVNIMRNYSKTKFYDIMFRGYIKGIKQASDTNDTKIRQIKQGQKCLLFALISIGVLIGFVLITNFLVSG